MTKRRDAREEFVRSSLSHASALFFSFVRLFVCLFRLRRDSVSSALSLSLSSQLFVTLRISRYDNLSDCLVGTSG